MASVINRQQLNLKNCSILYDASVISTPDVKIFDAQHWQVLEQVEVKAVSKGRGAAWFINQTHSSWVLRHYRRGGLVAKINTDHYFSYYAAQTRAFKEWDLLCWMFQKNLPVPQPVAALACWSIHKIFGFYRADILVKSIPNSQNISDYLLQQTLSATLWQNMGKCIQHFHQLGIDHSDLNASNILINQQDEIFLIDFDKCSRRPQGEWQHKNIQRLKRSLDKFKLQHEGFNFNDSAWQDFLKGYLSTR